MDVFSYHNNIPTASDVCKQNHKSTPIMPSTHFAKSKILVHVDLHAQGRMAWGRTQASLHHLLVEELAHGLLSDAKGDIAHIEPASLSGHLAGCRLGGGGNREGGGGLSNSWGRSTHGGNLTGSCKKEFGNVRKNNVISLPCHVQEFITLHKDCDHRTKGTSPAQSHSSMHYSKDTSTSTSQR